MGWSGVSIVVLTYIFSMVNGVEHLCMWLLITLHVYPSAMSVSLYFVLKMDTICFLDAHWIVSVVMYLYVNLFMCMTCKYCLPFSGLPFHCIDCVPKVFMSSSVIYFPFDIIAFHTISRKSFTKINVMKYS